MRLLARESGVELDRLDEPMDNITTAAIVSTITNQQIVDIGTHTAILPGCLQLSGTHKPLGVSFTIAPFSATVYSF